MSFGKEFVNKRFDFVIKGQVEHIIDDQYHDDAVIISFPRTISGKEEIMIAFKGFVNNGQIESIELLDLVETDDQIFFNACIKWSSGDILHATEALYLVDGKVFRQFSHEQQVDR